MFKKTVFSFLIVIIISGIFIFSDAEANRGPGKFKDGGIGFLQLASWNRGYLNVKDRTGLWAVKESISDWQEGGRLYLKRDIFHLVDTHTPTSAYEIEIIFAGQQSELSSSFTEACNKIFVDIPWAYAAVFVKDYDGYQGDPEGADNFFRKGLVCLNPNKRMDKGIISHELGHLLGLDHPALTYSFNPPQFGYCRDTGRNSIMAYNYLAWRAQWPSNLAPTREDFLGPWVCDSRYPAGLDYIYEYTNTPGFGNSVRIDVRVGIMNATPSSVIKGDFPVAQYGMTIVNFSNTTVYDVRAVIGAFGTAEEVAYCAKLRPGEICGGPNYRSGSYGGWVGSEDWVNFGGDYYIIPKKFGSLVQHPKLVYIPQRIIDPAGAEDIRVYFIESNINPVSVGHPVTYKIKVCNYGKSGWIRPVIGSGDQRDYLDWEWLEFGECSTLQTHIEYYSHQGIDWVGFGAERFDNNRLIGIKPSFIIQEIK